MRTKYLIIGAGPTGLGAANRLLELGEDRFLVLERSSRVGGLGGSIKGSAGFTWDMGRHVLSSHYEYFDALLGELMGGDFLELESGVFVQILDTLVPYPFQNNIRNLPPEAQWECVRGLLPESGLEKTGPANFREWIYQTFGPGIAKYFMLPYNTKLWQTPLEEMEFHWTAGRISTPPIERVLKNLILGRDDIAPDSGDTFRFPLYGGTGEIFRRLAKRVGDNVAIDSDIVRIDLGLRKARTRQGKEYEFESVLYTGPLDKLVLQVLSAAPEPLHRAAEDLKHSGAVISGIGLKGYRPDETGWTYYPEQKFPFYRVTNLHSLSPMITPSREKYRAFMAEIAFPGGSTPPENAWDESFEGLLKAGLVNDNDRERIADRFETVLEYAYPAPTLSRDAALRTIQPFLEEHGIYSRGRFGGWKYEAGNMDHSVMQGVEWAERMVLGYSETTLPWRRFDLTTRSL